MIIVINNFFNQMVAFAPLLLDNIKIYFLLKLFLNLEKTRVINVGTCIHVKTEVLYLSRTK